MSLEKIVYTAHATAAGGREGSAKSDSGELDGKLLLSQPEAVANFIRTSAQAVTA